MAKTSYTLSLLLMLSLACFVSSQDILPPLLTVTGKGEVKAQPDEVSVTVGIQLRAKSVEEVSSDTDSRSAAIIAYLQAKALLMKIFKLHMLLYSHTIPIQAVRLVKPPQTTTPHKSL